MPWIAEECEFCEADDSRLVLPVGLRIDPYDVKANPAKFDSEEIRAAKECAARTNVDRDGRRNGRQLTFVTVIRGRLRVINREWTVEVKPANERTVPILRPRIFNRQ